jgi:tricorn protease-like protein
MGMGGASPNGSITLPHHRGPPAACTMSEDAYLRQPTLHEETVVFVSDDDLWR